MYKYDVNLIETTLCDDMGQNYAYMHIVITIMFLNILDSETRLIYNLGRKQWKLLLLVAVIMIKIWISVVFSYEAQNIRDIYDLTWYVENIDSVHNFYFECKKNNSYGLRDVCFLYAILHIPLVTLYGIYFWTTRHKGKLEFSF